VTPTQISPNRARRKARPKKGRWAGRLHPCLSTKRRKVLQSTLEVLRFWCRKWALSTRLHILKKPLIRLSEPKVLRVFTKWHNKSSKGMRKALLNKNSQELALFSGILGRKNFQTRICNTPGRSQRSAINQRKMKSKNSHKAGPPYLKNHKCLVTSKLGMWTVWSQRRLRHLKLTHGEPRTKSWYKRTPLLTSTQ